MRPRLAPQNGETVPAIKTAARKRILNQLYILLASGLNQSQAAERMGVTPAAVSQWLAKARRDYHGKDI